MTPGKLHWARIPITTEKIGLKQEIPSPNYKGLIISSDLILITVGWEWNKG